MAGFGVSWSVIRMRQPPPDSGSPARLMSDLQAAPDDGCQSSLFAALDELMTAEQVAALLLLPTSTVKDYARRGVLPSIKLGKHRRFVRSQVQSAIEALAQREG